MQNTVSAGTTRVPAAGPKPGDDDTETHLRRLLTEQRYREAAVYLHAIAAARTPEQPDDQAERTKRGRVRHHARRRTA